MNPEKYPLITSPENIPARFTEAWNERDPEKVAAIFDEDAEFVNVVGIWWHNREEIYKAYWVCRIQGSTFKVQDEGKFGQFNDHSIKMM